MPDHPDVIAVLKEAEERNISTFGGTWHSDFSFLPEPPMGSLLYALEVPECGGDTLWADMYRAYEALSPGLRNLLDAVERNDLRALVLFSSSTARYGRVGQVDYAIANEVLNKVAQQEARRLPDCRVLSLNWGPWEGGMVDESLRAVFANEGVPLIPLAQGADHLLRELATDETAVERLVLGLAR